MSYKNIYFSCAYFVCSFIEIDIINETFILFQKRYIAIGHKAHIINSIMVMI